MVTSMNDSRWIALMEYGDGSFEEPGTILKANYMAYHTITFVKPQDLVAVHFGIDFEIVSMKFSSIQSYLFVVMQSSDTLEKHDFKSLHAKSLSELLVKLDLANALYDEPSLEYNRHAS